VQKVWSWLAVELGKRAGLISAVALVLTGILGFGLTKLDFATDQKSYLNTDDQVYIDNVRYQDLFGGQAMLSVIEMDEGVTLVDFLSPENQAELERVADEIKRDEGVRAVVTPSVALGFSDTLIQKGPDGEQAPGPTESIAGGALAFAAGLGGEGPDDLHEVADTPEAEARTADSLTTLERLDAVPAAERTLDNPEWREFLLYDNTGEVRKSLRPFFPNASTALIASRGIRFMSR